MFRLSPSVWVACWLVIAWSSADALAAKNVIRRGDLNNSRARFEREGKGHVAFMGGSITEMNGYRPMVMDLLRKRFPKTTFTFTDAGISSTCSTTGAFRLQSDVLSKGPVDLFFVEFAVNDDQDAAHARDAAMRGMEGIIRHLRKHNPHADIVVTYFVNPGMRDLLQKGEVPVSIAAHQTVIDHYPGVHVIHLAREVAEQIKSGKLTWKQFGGTHPAPFGNAIAAKMISQLLDAALAKPLPEANARKPHALPKPLDEHCYERGRFVPTADVKLADGWTRATPDWSKLKGQCRSRFVKEKLFVTSHAGATLSVKFTGTALGAYVLAGPDAGVLEASIDGSPWRKVDLYHRFSAGLHYPRTVLFAHGPEARRPRRAGPSLGRPRLDEALPVRAGPAVCSELTAWIDLVCPRFSRSPQSVVAQPCRCIA